MNKSKKNKTKQIDFEQEDEFDLDEHSEEQPADNKIKDKKSIANIYQQLLTKKKAKQQDSQHAQKVQSKKDKKKAKQQIKKEQIKQQESQKKQIKDNLKEQKKISSSCVYINNKALQDQLRKDTLRGVTKIFNLIVNHKKEIES